MEFYVYEWFNIDTEEVFYVGKGKDERYKSLKNRNRYFLRYLKKYNCSSRIIVPYMNNEDAYAYEKRLIEYYKKIGYCKTNIAEGGLGGIRMFSTSNPMYGRTWWNDNTPQSKIDAWKTNVARKGINNGMYGISPLQRMTKEKYIEWRKKQQENKIGKRNPNYGNCKLSKVYAEDVDLAKAKQGRPGKQNGRCIPVDLYDIDMNYIRSFDYYGECADYLIASGFKGTKKENLAIKISDRKKNGKPYKGYYFK